MKKVEIFLFDGADGMDVMGPLEVFSSATETFKYQGIVNKGYEVVFSAVKPGRIKLASGLEVIAEHAIASGDKSDYLVVPGGIDVQRIIKNGVENERIVEQLGSGVSRAKCIVSICTGAFFLARLGLLNGRRCTTHWRYADRLAEHYPLVDVNADAIYVEDGNIFTSAGVTAGIDLALALVEKDYGSKVAVDVARNLVLYLRRPGNQSQFSAPIELRNKAGDMFCKLHDWMLVNIDSALNVEALADFMAMSPRHFARLFASETGITPGKYIELMRIEKARELLSATSQSVSAIASLSGFHREERMRRIFIKNLGVTPSQYRCHFGVR